MSTIKGRRTGRWAKGTFNRGRPSVSCRFDDETFEWVNRYALSLNISFTEMVRIFVREGLKRREDARRAA